MFFLDSLLKVRILKTYFPTVKELWDLQYRMAAKKYALGSSGEEESQGNRAVSEARRRKRRRMEIRKNAAESLKQREVLSQLRKKYQSRPDCPEGGQP